VASSLESGETSGTTSKTTSSVPAAVSEEPVAKKQAVAKSSAVAIDTSISAEKRIDAAITLIMKYRLGGDGGNALKLLITFIKNIVDHPDDPKYRSINTESNAYKTKLANLVGPLNLLLSLGFERVTEDGVEKLKYNQQPMDVAFPETLTKLLKAEDTYRRMN